MTLLGEREDWEDMLERIQFLTQFGIEHEELALWNSVLTAVVSKFVGTFDCPDEPETVRFWQQTVHVWKDGWCSGDEFVTGWVLAFCFWDLDGKPLVIQRLKRLTKDWKVALKNHGLDYWFSGPKFGKLEYDNVPDGYAHVPVHVNNKTKGEKYVARAIAGSVGWTVRDSEEVFAQTRGSRGPAGSGARKDLRKSSTMSTFSFARRTGTGGIVEPSEYTGATLVESKPSLLKRFTQLVLCSTDTPDSKTQSKSLSQSKKGKESSTISPAVITPSPSTKPNSSSKTYALPPTPKVYSNEFENEVSKLLPTFSDLGELQEPWEYEPGGQNDTLQPVTGWWVIRDPTGTYGRDEDYPDVDFGFRRDGND